MTSFVQKAIETGKRRKWCMSYGCTTCGANNFRNRIYGPLKVALNLTGDLPKFDHRADDLPLVDDNYDRQESRMTAPWDEISPIDNKIIFESLLEDMKQAKLDTRDYDIFHAMRLIIMELYNRNAENILGNTFEHYLGDSDFGTVLEAMRHHYEAGKLSYQLHLERQRIAQIKKLNSRRN